MKFIDRRFVGSALALLVAAALLASTPALAGGGLLAGRSLLGQEQHLYRTLMLRAAPGELATVIDMIQARMPAWRDGSAVGPFWMRHSQGDQWDLLVLYHLGRGFDEYYGEGARERRHEADRVAGETEVEFILRLLPHLSWREELYVWGPPPELVAERFDGAGYFHVEIFLALAGKRNELLRQREMENRYLEGINRAPNLIFSRAGGAPWDCYTIGFYRDLKHFAESADIPDALQEQAAVAAGFESASTIGTYLRELIVQHHDTLAVTIR